MAERFHVSRIGSRTLFPAGRVIVRVPRRLTRVFLPPDGGRAIFAPDIDHGTGLRSTRPSGVEWSRLETHPLGYLITSRNSHEPKVRV